MIAGGKKLNRYVHRCWDKKIAKDWLIAVSEHTAVYNWFKHMRQIISLISWYVVSTLMIVEHNHLEGILSWNAFEGYGNSIWVSKKGF
jgi:hypothetical protein